MDRARLGELYLLADNLVSVCFLPGSVAHEYAHAVVARARGYEADVTLAEITASHPGAYVSVDGRMDPRTYWLMVFAPLYLCLPLAVGLFVLAPALPAPADVGSWYLGLSLLFQGAPSENDLTPPAHVRRSMGADWPLRVAKPVFAWGYSLASGVVGIVALGAVLGP